MTPTDIKDVLGPRASLTVTAEENADDRAARLTSSARWDRFDLFKHYVIFVVTLIAIVGVSGICVHFMLFDAAATPDSVRWAQTVLSSVITGSVSFVLGQMSRK